MIKDNGNFIYFKKLRLNHMRIPAIIFIKHQASLWLKRVKFTVKSIFSFVILFMLLSGVMTASGSAQAAGATPPANGTGRDATAVLNKISNRVTPAQRQAAADRRLNVAPVKGKAAVGGKMSLQGAPVGAPQGLAANAPVPGGKPDYFNYANWTNSPILRKFVDSLPGLGAANTNNLGQYIPVAIADTATYPNSDYYEIAVVEYSEQMHSDLPASKLRGYVQLETPQNAAVSKHFKLTYPNGQPILDSAGNQVLAVDKPHYLGPTIVAQKDVPTRIKFVNYLPTGAGGDLFIPVDATVMGAGMGPLDMPGMPGMKEDYKQNRATLHLHGGLTPWISDGTPHQWTTPAGENTVYPKGVSVQNVPDMPDPGPGAMTFFYSNQQGARLLFYHDHSYGITRLNVYAGEAAGYLITDAVEQDLIAQGALPAEQIPLIIQDKSFVPDAAKLAATDPTWDSNKWGGYGQLWFPHVYMPNQNPNDPQGINAFGRWDYGPWFWPPVTPDAGLIHPSVIDPVTGIESPGTPDVSMTMEAFMDTPLVNGTAYPYVTVQPKAYRLRVLNASNDRFWNLQFYQADPSAVAADGRALTEVKMIPSVPGPNIPSYWPTMDYRAGGVPDPTMAGPEMIQVATEGGWLPAPATLPNTPIGYDTDTRSITIGNVKEHTLFLGPAERADVVVDFSAFAGKTIILYNDAPSPVPAIDPRLDYYTGNPDLTSTGGAPSTQAGFGPNTRTIMQFRVAGGNGAPFDRTILDAALPVAFKNGTNPIVVPEAAYNTAYNANFTNKHARIADTSLTFTPDGSTTALNLPLQPKAIQELFELDYGRMNSTLGVELPLTNFNTQTTIPLGYIDPVTETITDSMTPLAPVAGDGTQLWKITHNGVDTHAIHFHLFDVQLINRVDWAGVVKPPEANELGWKDTVRMNPLEDTIVALRPIAPKQPFGIPDSVRPMDPTMPLGSTYGFSKMDANNKPVTTVNQIVNFGWEYVWHCHLLGHEEMDMMRPIKFLTQKALPLAPVSLSANVNGKQVDLTWTDPTPAIDPATWGNPANEINHIIERADVATDGTVGTYAQIGTALANATSFTDSSAGAQSYSYRVVARNESGTAASNEQTVAVAPINNTVTLSLQAGWNLITLPIKPVDTQTGQPFDYTAESFGKLVGADLVTKWLENTQQYSNHIVNTPINDFTLGGGLGFFVHVAAGGNYDIIGTPLPPQTLTAARGWNLWAWHSMTPITAHTLGLQAGGDLVAKFQNVNQQWSNHIMSLPLNNFSINGGEAVFVHKP